MDFSRKSTLPVLFVTHGSPMLAVEPGKTGPALTQLGQALENLPIKAVLVVSAHWITRRDPYILASNEALKTIYDFGGFPRALYELTYPATGSAAIAQKIQATLASQNIKTHLDPERGLDHGAWVPLRYLFPKPAFPILQLSLPWPLNAEKAIELGKSLQALREQGILIITSGSMTHNLRDVGDNPEPAPYVTPFVDWMRQTLHKRDSVALGNYRTLAPYAQNAHPTEEHLFPLMVAFGASTDQDQVHEIYDEITYHALAMDHYLWF